MKNKNVVLTGGGRGIGREIAKKLSSYGANLALLARTESELRETYDIINEVNSRTFYRTLDISDAVTVRSVFNDILDRMGRIDCLINNAGIQSPIGEFSEVNSEEWQRNFNVNLFGTTNCTFAVLKKMILQKKGKIINMSGGGSTSPRTNFSAYAVSKTAVVRFTETLAEEVRKYNIDVNTIAPGAINTRMLDEVISAGESAGKEFGGALKRKEEGGDSFSRVADLVSFLVSDLSDGITGKLISAKWDDWESKEFQTLARNEKDFATLRRIDNKTFFKKI